MARYDAVQDDGRREAFVEELLAAYEPLLPGLRESLTFLESATPRTLERYSANHAGAIYGWENSPAHAGTRRLHHRTPVEGLFLCGHWTQPGSGSFRVIFSGRRDDDERARRRLRRPVPGRARAGLVTVQVDRNVAVHDARRRHAARRRLPPGGRRAGARDPVAHAVRPPLPAHAGGRDRSRARRRGGLRARRPGRARAARLRRRVRPVRRPRAPTATTPSSGSPRSRGATARSACRGARTSARRSGSRRPSSRRALKAIAPVVTGSDYFHGWVYQGGAFQLGFNLFWVHMMSGRKRQDSLTMQFEHLPLKEPPLLDEGEAGRLLPRVAEPLDRRRLLAAALDQPPLRAHAGAGASTSAAGTTSSSAARWRTSRPAARGGSEAARAGRGWSSARGRTAARTARTRTRASRSSTGVDKIDLDGRAAALLRRAPGRRAADRGPPVRLFVMGANVWRDEDDWPLARARDTNWYLRADGGLSPEPPADEAPDELRLRPGRPGAHARRADVAARASSCRPTPGRRTSARSRSATTCSSTPPSRWTRRSRSPAR